MGCFDIVNVQCPSCGARIQMQSKAGACDLTEYDEDAVPVAIAADIDWDRATCESCHQKIRIDSEAPEYVRVEARKVNP